MSRLPEAKGHDLHLSPNERLKILYLRKNEGMTAQEVAKRTGHSKSTVDFTVKKWDETHDVREHLSGGPHRSYDDNDLYKLECLIDGNPSATADDLIGMMGSSAPQVDATTIRRYRYVLGYTKRKPAPWVIDTEKSVRDRHNWAVTNKDANHSKWVFMDETTVCLRDTGDIVWIKRGEATPRHPIEKLKCSVNIWGIIWNKGSHFQFYNGSLTKEKYCEMLESSLNSKKVEIKDRLVLHDQHPAHKSNLVKQWIASHSFTFLFTPPHSPQFNAIEEVWAWVKHDVKKSKLQNEDQLRAACEHAWSTVPQAHIVNYISHASDMIKQEAQNQI